MAWHQQPGSIGTSGHGEAGGNQIMSKKLTGVERQEVGSWKTKALAEGMKMRKEAAKYGGAGS